MAMPAVTASVVMVASIMIVIGKRKRADCEYKR
jgi:hypothetical protein